ncbi:hypothetical protein UFOVP240_198 [uncultured Caudovirales phage]|uniref:Uncharacterized protein n=1 Tax=uncultured Caudovirales phage TaxID=2100421 RepID=A0A6J7WTY9_9CAUD|nr:hypothetical protein UFOVP240_198 [uncultured Caudovirales phage]
MAIKVSAVTVIDDSRNGTLNSLNIDGTSRLKLPVGNISQRPGTPTQGDLRYNSEVGSIEVYSGTTWILLAAIADDALTFALMGLY